MQRITDERNARRNIKCESKLVDNPTMNYKSNKEKADDAKYKLTLN